MSLATRQYITDRNKEHGWDKLHKDLITYHKVKNEWGLGHVRCRIQKCRFKHGCPEASKQIPGMEHKHLFVLGHYTDYLYFERNELLGYTLDHALERVAHLKAHIVKHVALLS